MRVFEIFDLSLLRVPSPGMNQKMSLFITASQEAHHVRFAEFARSFVCGFICPNKVIFSVLGVARAARKSGLFLSNSIS